MFFPTIFRTPSVYIVIYISQKVNVYLKIFRVLSRSTEGKGASSSDHVSVLPFLSRKESYLRSCQRSGNHQPAITTSAFSVTFRFAHDSASALSSRHSFRAPALLYAFRLSTIRVTGRTVPQVFRCVAWCAFCCFFVCLFRGI